MGTLEKVPRLDPAFPQPLVPFSFPSTQAPHLSEQRCSSQAEALWQMQLGVGLNP